MRDRLGSAFDSPDSKSRYVRRLFSTIADRYDLITVLLSYGNDQRWKRRLVSMARDSPGISALDLACGTGDIAYALHDAGARTVGLDITPRMVELARAKRSSALPAFLVGDMMALPFGNSTFDVVTTGYGLDFDRPQNAFVRGISLSYLTVVGSIVGLALHGDPDTYRYIPESIRRYPGSAGVCRIAKTQGFSACDAVGVLGGLMAIHRAVK